MVVNALLNSNDDVACTFTSESAGLRKISEGKLANEELNITKKAYLVQLQSRVTLRDDFVDAVRLPAAVTGIVRRAPLTT
jgi:hypothetical protein